MALSEACLASDRVRTVDKWPMKLEMVNDSTVPDLAETMVPAGNRMSFTFRFDSVKAIMASSSVSKAGAHRATGTPRDRTRDTALLEDPA